MFGFGKKRRFEDWMIMGCGFIAENNRVYENIVDGELQDSNPGDPDYIAGKYLFRTFGANAAIAGAGIQNKLDEDLFSQLQNSLKLACIQGNKALPTSKTLEKMNNQPGFMIEEIDIPMSLAGGIGAEFMDKTWTSFIEFCAGKEYASEVLVELYIQALNYPLKGQDTRTKSVMAMGMFTGLRNAVMKQV